jgi:lipid-A-disaccharide synthase
VRNIFIIAGEASGDAYGGALVSELVTQDSRVRVAGLGGPQMAAAGVDLMQDLTTHAMMGFAGLLENVGGLFRAYRRVVHRLSIDRPDAVVLIDFPEFNLLVARHAKRIGIPVIYYVSPQVWAWRTGRVRKIAKRVRKMLCLFEFEKAFYEDAGVDVTHVGHPLLDTMADKLGGVDRAAVRRSLGLPESGTVIGLLPGSRRKEIEYIYPLLLTSAGILQNELKNVTFVTARADKIKPAQLETIAAKHAVAPTVVAGRAHDVMLASDLLLIASGTATLEAGLLGTPMVVTYQGPLLSYVIFGALVNAKLLALANIVAEREVVPELYMVNAKPERIAAAALDILRDGGETMRQDLGIIREKLGRPGATARAAEEILKII